MKIKEEYVRFAAENIERYYEKEASLGERMRANFAELAAFAAASAASDVRSREFFAVGTPITDYFEAPSADNVGYAPIEESEPFVNARLAHSEAAYLADFCMATTERLKTSARLKPSPLLFSEYEKREGGRVAFTDSHILNEAYRVFTSGSTGYTSAFVSSFTEACEDTAAGLAKYCILPIENGGEGLLQGSFSLIERYELFICSVCTVDVGQRATKFALLCRNVCGIIESNKVQTVMLRLFGNESYRMSRLYIGADVLRIFGGSLLTVPLGYTDGYADICTFTGTADALFAFLMYLGVMRIGHTLMGVYDT